MSNDCDMQIQGEKVIDAGHWSWICGIGADSRLTGMDAATVCGSPQNWSVQYTPYVIRVWTGQI